MGLAQDGALELGRQGASTADILQHFYPGTTLGEASGDVRVALTGGVAEVVVSFPSGGEIRSSGGSGFPVSVASGGSVRLSFDGAYRAEPLSGAKMAALSAGRPVVLEAPAAQEGGGLLGGGLLGGDSPPTTAPPAPPPPPPLPPLGELPPGAEDPSAPAPPEPEDVASSGSPLQAVPNSGGTVAIASRGARYRGVIHATAAEGGLRLVNQLDVEDYLRGMGEVRDSSWPRASLGAQAVAARTYALRAMAGGGELCDTQDCQVYLGQQAEYGAMDSAVAATRGQVVRYGGALAQAVYSASGGGISSTPEEGFGTSSAGLPYLTSTPYPTADPQAWEVRIPLDQLAPRLGYRGTVSDVRVAAAGPSGRALTVELVGDAGPQQISGLAFRDQLGLRSTLWTVRVEAPPPGPEGEGEAAAGAVASEGRELGAGRPAGALGGAAPGRALVAAGSPSAGVLADLEGPLRTAAALSTAALVIGACGGLAFRRAGRRGSPELAVEVAGDAG